MCPEIVRCGRVEDVDVVDEEIVRGSISWLRRWTTVHALRRAQNANRNPVRSTLYKYLLYTSYIRTDP